MTIPRKPDSIDIEAFVEAQLQEQWLQLTDRRDWPRYLYHFTDVNNVVKILESGYVFSRKDLEDREIDFVDTGPNMVLQWTDKTVMSCARLTFRPLTPTQYHHEGIKTQEMLNRGRTFDSTHCPVPVFLLFDAVGVLCLHNSRFSGAGLGRIATNYLSTAEDLKGLPWKDIYGTGPISSFDSRKDEKISRRNAEVIVPEKVELSYLKRIHCRSVAEKETLLHLLPNTLRDKYIPLVTASARDAMFKRNRTYVHSVAMSSEEIRINFWPDTECPGPFNARFVIREVGSERMLLHDDIIHTADGSYNLIFGREIERYAFDLHLDGFLAYSHSYVDKPMIFEE